MSGIARLCQTSPENVKQCPNLENPVLTNIGLQMRFRGHPLTAFFILDFRFCYSFLPRPGPGVALPGPGAARPGLCLALALHSAPCPLFGSLFGLLFGTWALYLGTGPKRIFHKLNKATQVATVVENHPCNLRIFSLGSPSLSLATVLAPALARKVTIGLCLGSNPCRTN